MRLHYLVKLKLCDFCVNCNAGKRNSTNFTYWFCFHFLKKMQVFDRHHVMSNLIRKTCRPTKLCHNRPRYVEDMTKTFRCVCQFTVPTAVHWQNANAKFTRLDRVETLFRLGRERLHFCMTNLPRTICTKFYHNRSGFIHCI